MNSRPHRPNRKPTRKAAESFQLRAYHRVMAAAMTRNELPRVVPLIAWALVVLAFAASWYTYDASRGLTQPFSYYLGWSGYIWALLTPAALWLGWRFPISSTNWPRRVALHLAAGLALTGVQVALEAGFGWLRHQHGLSAQEALRHYYSQHTQICLLTYWLLVGAAQIHRSRELARAGRLHAATLEAQLSAARLEMLRRQLHPHFLFNTLQAATTLIHEDANRAEEVLLRLSDLLRVSLYESEHHEIPLRRELDILSHYIAIQSCRFGDRLQFKIQVDPALLGCAVPSLLLQPLVENAVRHGIGAHRAADTVTIEARRQGDVLHLSVSNRNSELKAAPERLFGPGVGLMSTRERLQQLYGAHAAQFVLRNLQPRGVCAAVSLPLKILVPPSAPVPQAAAHA